MDGTDCVILSLIQEDGRVSNAEMARSVGMAPSAVLERVRKLERAGVIKKYEAVLRPKSLGFTITAFTFVKAEEAAGSIGIGEALARIPTVIEVHYTAGRDSYLIKVRARDPEHLQNILQEIGAIPGVRETHSTIVLTTIKETRMLPLPGEGAHGLEEETTGAQS